MPKTRADYSLETEQHINLLLELKLSNKIDEMHKIEKEYRDRYDTELLYTQKEYDELRLELNRVIN